MYPRTETVPKCLLEVAGRPFTYWQLDWLASQHVGSVVYSIGHLGAMIRGAVGDGSPWGLSVDYVDEGDRLRGTGGALRLAWDEGVLDDEFFVLYGDSYLLVDLAAVEEAFHARGTDALMTVYRNRGRWETSNAVFSGGMVTWYAKGIAERPPDMEFVDYGLSVLRASVVSELIPRDAQTDLAEIFSTLSLEGRLAGYEASDRFFEIGTSSGLDELEDWLRTGGANGGTARVRRPS